MTIQLTFTTGIQAELNHGRYYESEALVRRRMEVLWLKSQGLPHHQITHLASVSENTMRTYFRLYQNGGLERVKALHWHRPHSELEAHHEVLKASFDAQPPATIKEAQHRIEALTGLRRSTTQVRIFLKKTPSAVL